MSPDDLYYSDTRGNNLFGFTVEDDSFEPCFKRGDIAVVNPNLHGRPGDYIVASKDGKATLGRLAYDGQTIEPVAKTGEPVRVSEAEILGRVVERKRLYR